MEGKIDQNRLMGEMVLEITKFRPNKDESVQDIDPRGKEKVRLQKNIDKFWKYFLKNCTKDIKESRFCKRNRARHEERQDQDEYKI